MSDYLKRLSIHPGLPIAGVFTLAGFVVGLEHGLRGALLTALIASVVWVPVLITARTQPLSTPPEKNNDE